MVMMVAMTPQNILIFQLLLVIMCTNLSTTESAESVPRTRKQRSTANLEYVMRVLEEQGRLGEVDEDLLKRIQASIRGSKVQDESHIQSEINRNIVEHKVSSNPRVSALERAKIRQQQLFGTRGQNRSPQRSFPYSSKKQLLGGECQALKTENTILKQQLLAAQSQDPQEPKRSLELSGSNLLNKLQEDSSPNSPIIQPAAGPLDRLIQVASQERGNGQNDQFGNLVSSILITPTPTISTILDTTSFVTTTTVTLTREIGIYFHGKRIPTHILDTEVQVQTVTSTLSTTVEITPTPTWQTITITPTVTPSPPPDDSNAILANKKIEQERQALINRIKSLNNPKPEIPRSIGGVRAEVVEIPEALDSFESLQKYVQQIRKLKSEQLPKIIAQPLKSIPSTSVSTVYMSGTVPGEYSTSLVTIALDEEGNPVGRRKRQVEVHPSSLQPVLSTQIAEIGEDTIENHNDVEILSSFNVDTKLNKALDQCSDKTVTVTVTEDRRCLP